jgi:hypothetical protein
MKIRNGFVSNSSSSSFVLYGIYLEDASELPQQLAPKYLQGYFDWLETYEYRSSPEPQTADNIDEDDFNEWMDYGMPLGKTENDNSLQIRRDYDSDCAYIGLSYTQLKDDETGADFKKRATQEIAEMFPNHTEKVDWQDFTIYN